MKTPNHILPAIVISQFCCTSLWFAGNAVMGDLVDTFALGAGALGHLTSAVQFGFISGTLIFALLTIADRFSPSKVFLISALLGAVFNMGSIREGNDLVSLLVLRFSTGFFLAGIYPIGMKIAADYFEKGLGKSLGFLVGALVVGTAFPHLLKDLTSSFDWSSVMLATSALAAIGGLLMFILVPNGPFRKAGHGLDLSAIFRVFGNANFRSAAFGYFGHMWELYTFWAFVPVMLHFYSGSHPGVDINVPVWSFAIIGVGGPACVLGGYLSQALGIKRTAFAALLLSCLCCLLSPLMLSLSSVYLVLTFLIFWGIVVIADSPLFSTLVAQNAPAEIKGTALTIVNSIGFAITIISIQVLSLIKMYHDSTTIYMLLALGPVLGLIALSSKKGRARFGKYFLQHAFYCFRR